MRRVKKQRDLRSIKSDKTLRKPSVTAVAAVFFIYGCNRNKTTKLCPYYHCQQFVNICPVCEINLQPRPDSMTSLFYSFTAHCYQCSWYSKVNIFPEQTQYMPPESCYPLVYVSANPFNLLSCHVRITLEHYGFSFRLQNTLEWLETPLKDFIQSKRFNTCPDELLCTWQPVTFS